MADKITIDLSITKDTYNELDILADNHGTTADKLLSQFIHDLLDDYECNGSDEHYQAEAWFNRNYYNW